MAGLASFSVLPTGDGQREPTVRVAGSDGRRRRGAATSVNDRGPHQLVGASVLQGNGPKTEELVLRAVYVYKVTRCP